MAEHSVDRGERFGEGHEPGYRWTCSMCRGMGIVDVDETTIEDCPRCELARTYRVVFEIVKRNVTPLVFGERTASPAVTADRFIYEVYELRPDPEFPAAKARKVAAESDVESVYAAKFCLEEEAYGPLGTWGVA